MEPIITVNQYPIGWECLDISSEREYMNQYTDIRILTNEIKTMLTKGKFLVSFEVPGHTKEYTEGFKMVIPYRTEELNTYLSDPQAQYNKLLRTQQKLRNKKK